MTYKAKINLAQTEKSGVNDPLEEDSCLVNGEGNNEDKHEACISSEIKILTPRKIANKKQESTWSGLLVQSRV